MKVALAVLLFALAAVATAAPIPIDRFDLNHSTIGFRVPILGGMSEVQGKFTDFAIKMVYDEAAPAQSSVVAVIQAASIDTGVEDRDKHLRSEDFFDVAKHPEIRFQSTRIEKSGDGFIAHGTFTMHGVTKTIALPFRATGVKRDDEKKTLTVAFAAEMKLNRRDYGIAWRHNVDPLFVGDEVTVVIRLISRLIHL